MEFVSKQQAYEALRKLILEEAAHRNRPDLEEIGRNMAMGENGSSRDPALRDAFLDQIDADPLEPPDALAAAARFLEENVPPKGDADLAELIRAAHTTGDDPEKGDVALWNRWIGLLASV